MQLSRAGPTIRLCAYSGCWEGPVTFSRSRSDVHFLEARMRRDGPAGDAGTTRLSIMFSAKEATAQISWEGFFNVLECRSPRPD